MRTMIVGSGLDATTYWHDGKRIPWGSDPRLGK